LISVTKMNAENTSTHTAPSTITSPIIPEGEVDLYYDLLPMEQEEERRLNEGRFYSAAQSVLASRELQVYIWYGKLERVCGRSNDHARARTFVIMRNGNYAIALQYYAIHIDGVVKRRVERVWWDDDTHQPYSGWEAELWGWDEEKEPNWEKYRWREASVFGLDSVYRWLERRRRGIWCKPEPRTEVQKLDERFVQALVDKQLLFGGCLVKEMEGEPPAPFR